MASTPTSRSRLIPALILLSLITLCFPTLCVSHARSTLSTSEHENIFKSQLPFPKVPLPPSTTSVKCKCEPQVSPDVTHSHNSGNIQSRSDETEQPSFPDSSKVIEIEIFKPETDFRKVEQKQQHQGLQQDSSNVYEPLSTKSFKAFRTAELLDPYTENQNGPSEFLQLGKSFGPFEGPRKRRKRRDVDVPKTKTNNKVFYVYSVKFDNSSQYYGTSSTTTTTEKTTLFSSSSKLFSSFISPASKPNSPLNELNANQHDSKFSERNIEVDKFQGTPSPASLTLDEAMSKAWLDYGPKSVPPPHLPQEPPPPPSPPHGFLTLPQNSLFFNPSLQTPQNIYSRPPAYSYQFQRQGDLLTSAWDNRITQNPVSVFDRESSKPGFFSPLLARYIDFEVNNHEAADFARKLLFAFVIGTLIAAWIALGVVLGLFPLNLLFAGKETEKTRSNLDLLKRNTPGGGSDLENIGNRVMLALEPDWLEVLEERVKKNPQGHFIRTVAKCCVIPKEDKVVCILAKKDKNSGKVDGDPVSCGSDLIYNFQFGGDEDDDEVDEDADNVSRVKIRNSP